MMRGVKNNGVSMDHPGGEGEWCVNGSSEAKKTRLMCPWTIRVWGRNTPLFCCHQTMSAGTVSAEYVCTTIKATSTLDTSNKSVFAITLLPTKFTMATHVVVQLDIAMGRLWVKNCNPNPTRATYRRVTSYPSLPIGCLACIHRYP